MKNNKFKIFAALGIGLLVVTGLYFIAVEVLLPSRSADKTNPEIPDVTMVQPGNEQPADIVSVAVTRHADGKSVQRAVITKRNGEKTTKEYWWGRLQYDEVVYATRDMREIRWYDFEGKKVVRAYTFKLIAGGVIGKDKEYVWGTTHYHADGTNEYWYRRPDRTLERYTTYKPQQDGRGLFTHKYYLANGKTVRAVSEGLQTEPLIWQVSVFRDEQGKPRHLSVFREMLWKNEFGHHSSEGHTKPYRLDTYVRPDNSEWYRHRIASCTLGNRMFEGLTKVEVLADDSTYVVRDYLLHPVPLMEKTVIDKIIDYHHDGSETQWFLRRDESLARKVVFAKAGVEVLDEVYPPGTPLPAVAAINRAMVTVFDLDD